MEHPTQAAGSARPPEARARRPAESAGTATVGAPPPTIGRRIRVRGLVQGVGFRPSVWRVARELSLQGVVRNDPEGVLVEAWGPATALDALVDRLRSHPPPLARIDGVETTPLDGPAPTGEFRIEASDANGNPTTGVVPDAAICPACVDDTLDPASRRFRYPFTNCTECGPRFSIVRALPYDRANTSMAGFPMCPACSREYRDPADRRFHAQPNACPACGPTARLERADGAPVAPEGLDAVDGAATALLGGAIVAVKGLGGYHLACDACDPRAVEALRVRKRRDAKPFALMARDLTVVRRYARVTDAEAALLESPAAPIVLLAATGPERVAARVAPDAGTLGFMLPSTPLHRLLFERIDRAMVMTSGNLSDVPPCTEDEDARARLSGVADWFLVHDRPIENRIDDSVVRVVARQARQLRRARGYAPSPLVPPPGFEGAPRLLALGGELKNTFCLLDGGRAVVSQHMGDLEDARTYADWTKNLGLYEALWRFHPERLVVDLHPDYLSTKHGRARAAAEGLPVDAVQHHHAHVASCLFEHGLSRDAAPVLGIALDGLGMGDDGTLWGGEFLRCTYARSERLATFLPVPLLGGARAMREPWRNAFAHLTAEAGWDALVARWGHAEPVQALAGKPVRTLLALARNPGLSPPASSCGRLFDAVAAAVGLHRERVAFEGQAAMALEASVDAAALASSAPDAAYRFGLRRPDGGGLPVVEPFPMWRALLRDLVEGVPPGVVAARFHRGLAHIVVSTAATLCGPPGQPSRLDTVVLTGGVLQNAVLAELLVDGLSAAGLRVLLPRLFPANDGGLALGQAAVAAARQLATRE